MYTKLYLKHQFSVFLVAVACQIHARVWRIYNSNALIFIDFQLNERNFQWATIAIDLAKAEQISKKKIKELRRLLSITKNWRKSIMSTIGPAIEDGNLSPQKLNKIVKIYAQNFSSSNHLPKFMQELISRERMRLLCQNKVSFFDFWPRAMLKGPKRSFVVLVVLVVDLGVESSSKNVTKNVSKHKTWQK